MSTRTTNSWGRVALWRRTGLSIVAALTLAAWCATAFAAANKSGKPDKDHDEKASEPEKTLPPILQKALEEKEAQITDARREAIRLIEAYLRENPRGSAGFRPKEQAESLYKLAELYWEESKEVYLEKMGRYQAAVSACHADRSECPKVPHRPPTIDLTRAQATYLQLIDQYPKFRKIDTVIYLYAFSLRDQGKLGESIKYFQIILDKYPRSRYIADAWMAIAEYRFYEQQDYKTSLEAYEKVLKHPKSTLYDLALFKTAWCYWKLGDTTKSALRFKDVLDLAKKKAGRSEEQQKRAEELQGEALDYLVELFTEDDTKTARDAFEFLAQIGGKQYSRKVLKQLADTVFDQTRYERAVEAYRLLIELDPNAADAPDYAGKIVEGYQLLGDIKTAVEEMRKLASDYGGRSAWASANKDRPKAVEHARTMAEGLIRNLAKTMHGEAQQTEKTTKVVDKDRYARAAEAYQFYLANFPEAADAAELRYLRADILYFKLGKYEDAGREYLAVGKTQPVGKYHKDALLQSMGAFEKVRKPIPSNGSGAGKREITDSDRLFGEAADLYATLFPNDKEIVTVIYKNGQFFFDYGDYDEAVKRFGLIVERYPDDPNAGAAGDRILQALGKAKDYENIESWARRLKKTKAFAPQGRAGAPGQADRRRGHEVGREVRGRRRVREGSRLLPARAQRVPSERQRAQGAQQRRGGLREGKEAGRGGGRLQAAGGQVPRGQRGARGALHRRPHRREHRLLRQGRRALRAAGGEVPAERARRRRAPVGRRPPPEPRPARSRHQALRRVRPALQGSARRQGRRLSSGRRARGSEGLARRRGLLRGVQQGLSGRQQDGRGAGPRGRRAPQGRQRCRGQGDRRQGARRLRQARQGERPRGRRSQLLRRGGPLHSGRARFSRLREDQDRRQAEGSSPRFSKRKPSDSRRPSRSTSMWSPTSHPSGRPPRCCASARATRPTPRRCATRRCRRISRKTRSRCTATSWRRSSW